MPSCQMGFPSYDAFKHFLPVIRKKLKLEERKMKENNKKKKIQLYRTMRKLIKSKNQWYYKIKLK